MTEFSRMTGVLTRNICELRKPVVAALNGVTAGAGAAIALASDFRIAAENVKIAFLFTKVGLTAADMGDAYLLPRIVGTARAMSCSIWKSPSEPSAPSRSAWSPVS